MEEKKKAIVYSRFSPRKNSDSCESIESQLDFCRRWCAENNVEIVGEFADRALSGVAELANKLFNLIYNP